MSILDAEAVFNDHYTDRVQLAIARKKEVIAYYGGGLNLSCMLGISHPAVSKWKKIPPFRAYQIEQLGDFTVEYMRPDLKTPRIAFYCSRMKRPGKSVDKFIE